jgi:hypothetical protein
MTGIKFAICIDIPEFHGNQIIDRSWCSKFPGAQWMYAFFALAGSHGAEVVSGDLALTHVQSGYWNAKDVWVIQELNATHGRALISLGARPFVLTGFESPLYAYEFYDDLSIIAPKFANRILFGGAFSLFDGTAGSNIQLFFPNFDEQNLPPLVPWIDRKQLVLVAANKYWKEPFRLPVFNSARAYIGWLWHLWKKKVSKNRKIAISTQLHDKRLEAIEYFGSSGTLTIFGAGWSDFSRLPNHWRLRLGKLLASLDIARCEDKVAVMSNYRFALCFENIAYPGYVTEKIIDCFVAGVIPIYLGAPDIESLIPRDAFVDAREFIDLVNLEAYLSVFDDEKAIAMINAGRAFLSSECGNQYSNQGFARFVWKQFEKDCSK